MNKQVQRAEINSIEAVSSLPTIYGCGGLFDLCSDQDLMSLSFQGGSAFLDWIGWEKTDVCIIKKNFITFVRPEATGGARSTGYISNPCGDSKGVEWGFCDFTLEDFGRIRRHGPVRDVTKTSLRLCSIQPRYRLDGTPITNDAEYDMRLATEGIIQDMKLMIINGNKQTAGQFDGLERLVKTGYLGSSGKRCTSMDSVVINWNSNPMAGGNGITWNGRAVANTWTFIDVLLSVFRRIQDRMKWTPVLQDSVLGGTDMVLVAPTNMCRCILDQFTCWSVCPGVQYSPAVLQTYEARNFRDKLLGGAFGAGKITLDGTTINLLPYEWGLIKSATLSDVYLLTGSCGGLKFISAQYNDLTSVPVDYPDGVYSYTDGGRLLTWSDRQQTCLKRTSEMQPRMLMWAPWAQARFQNVTCDRVGGQISPDPWSSWFPEGSFYVAANPDAYNDRD